MGKKWIKISVLVDSSFADDAAASLAFETGRPVEMGEAGGGLVKVTVWFENGEGERPELVEAVRRAIGLWVSGASEAETPETAEEEDRDWLALWKKSFKPLPVGERLVIVPSWEGLPVDGERLPVILDPGMAFGTGHHPTTAGCLVLLEKYAASSVLDVGTGSGVLAIAAAKLGAERVLGVDTDAEAVRVAMDNARINKAQDRVRIVEGTAGAAPGEFGLVVANLYASVITKTAGTLREKTAPGGALIVSGLRAEQTRAAQKSLFAEGFSPMEQLREKDWVTLAFRRDRRMG
ncbi:MAG: 50S ribosomal protein L11 methyltransferase [Candidatus Nitrospinota bacterium M3_3B_026]